MDGWMDAPFALNLRESPSAETFINYFIIVFIHRYISKIFRKKKQNRNLLLRGHSKKERMKKIICDSSTWQEYDSLFPTKPFSRDSAGSKPW